ncbi:unnamed protein product [Mycena citricolor]|uniref:Uncharacterized protein n=1 Tax=Mycena citricolor TaxID=2018698 RepID=A0AAD2GSS6_9AGAR|nr:unnamed protein product [Mycena citricolor]
MDHPTNLPEIVSEPTTGVTLLSIFRDVYDSPILAPVMPYAPNDMFGARFKQLSKNPERGTELKRLFSQWSINTQLTGAAFEAECAKKVEECLWLATLLMSATGRKGHEPRLDFFLMHILTSAICLPSLLEAFPKAIHRVQLLQGYVRVTALLTLMRGRPRMDAELLMSYTDIPRPIALEKDEQTNPWLPIIHNGLQHPDAHVIKAIRSLYYAATHYGSTSAGQVVGAVDPAGKETHPGTSRLDGSAFVRAAGITSETMGIHDAGRSATSLSTTYDLQESHESTMDKSASIIAAFEAGKLPTTKQINQILDWLLVSGIPAVQPTADALSGQGRVLANDVRGILEAYKALNESKNKDNLMQEALWHISQGDTDVLVSSTNDVVDTDEAASDAKAVSDSVRTILTILWQSVVSEGSFLFNDLASFARLALADAAESLELNASGAKDGLRQVEKEVQDGKRDNLGRDKQRVEEEKDVRVAFEHGMDTLKGAGSSMIGAGQTAADKTEDISERTTTRLQKAYLKACQRAQNDREYHDSLSNLFDTVHKWVSKAFDTTTNQPFTLGSLVEDTTPEQHLHQALGAIKTMLDRFASPKCSVDDVVGKLQVFVSAIRGDSTEVKQWLDKFLKYAHKSLDDMDYSQSDEAKTTRRELRHQWRALLDADTEAGHAWTELKGTLETFGTAIAEDKDVERLQQVHGRLGSDIDRGLVEAGETAETGVQAVLERMSWFWHDLFAVYAPRMLSMLKDLPVPRTEYTDNDVELVLENLDISSLALNPAHVFIRNISDVDVRTSETGETKSAGVGAYTHIRMQAVQLMLKDVSFYYKDKTATLPPSEFTGLLELKMPPQGIDIDLKIRLIPSATERESRRAYHHIELVTVNISDDVDLTVRESNHAIVLSVFKPIFNMRFREALGKTLSEQLRSSIGWLDAVAWDVGRRSEVFSDAGLGSGASFAGAIWSELGRLTKGQSFGWRATGTGLVLEEASGQTKFAVGAEPQLLSGEKRGPVGTGSESVSKRVGDAVDAIKGETGRSGQDAQDAAKDVKQHVEGLVGEGQRQIRSFQRTVDEKVVQEKRTDGWKSSAFDL